MKKLFLAIYTVFFVSCSSGDTDINSVVKKATPKETKATYKVEVMLNWNVSNFPKNFPAGDHFSPLIGWTHNTSTTFFDEGTIASEGIKIMAETGGTSALKSEIEARIKANEGYKLIFGSGLGNGTGTITVEVEVTKENYLVTLATMIAPSPDWYIALVDANLYENNAFIVEKTFNAFPYDAGTDSGTDYTSSNQVTNPQEKIRKITYSPFNTGSVMAIVKFTKKN